MFEATGSPVISDGEQRKHHNFLTYSVQGLPNIAPDGFKIPFSAGHTRRIPRLTSGPFRYKLYADRYLDTARRFAHKPVKQAVISPSALSLMYPDEGLPGYSREQFIDDLLNEHETEVRRCLEKGAHKVQIDFTEGRLAVKLDPSGGLLNSFIHLNNLALARFSEADRARIGIHTCPGGDCDSTHSADVDYAELLPSLFALRAGNFYIALAGEKDRARVLRIIREHMKPAQRIFVGVISPIDPRIETAEEVRDRVLEAAEHIPLPQLGTTDDCGFSPLATTPPPRARPHLRKSARACRGPPSPRMFLKAVNGDARSRRKTASLRRLAKRARNPARARPGRGRVGPRQERLEQRTRELLQQREWFQVTLSSIGDAVIAIDVNTVVTFLTQWPKR